MIYFILFFIINITGYLGIFYLSYMVHLGQPLMKAALLGGIAFLVTAYWGYLTQVYHDDKGPIMVAALLNSFVAFSAYNVLPHLFLDVRFNYTWLLTGAALLVVGTFLVVKSIQTT